MLSQQLAGPFHRVDYPPREIRALEVPGYLSGQLTPEVLTATGVHTSISDHRELVNARRNKDQDAIAVARFFHAKLNEVSLRRRDWILHLFPADKHSDFT